MADSAGLSRLQFSVAFGAVALVMMLTSRWAPPRAARWGTRGALRRAMLILLTGGGMLALGTRIAPDSAWSLLLPMAWIAIGIALACAVTANGALRGLDHLAGTAVALHFCVQSLIVAGLGTALLVLLPRDSVWPLTVWCLLMPSLVLFGLRTAARA